MCTGNFQEALQILQDGSEIEVVYDTISSRQNFVIAVYSEFIRLDTLSNHKGTTAWKQCQKPQLRSWPCAMYPGGWLVLTS